MTEGIQIRYFLLVLLLYTSAAILPTAEALGADIVVVQSVARQVNEKIISGINSVISEKLVVANIDDLRTSFRSKPKLFVAIGQDALAAVKDSGVPVVFAMVMNPSAMGLEDKPITGVEVFISVGSQLDQLRAVLPKAVRLGIVYAPQSTGHIVDLAKKAAKTRGFTIVSRAVHSAAEAIVAMDSMTGVDVFWMLPDTTVVTQETVKHLILLSLERRIPVYAFSRKYAKNGAMLALGINPSRLGRQIGELADRVLSGEDAASIPFEPIESGDTYINTSVAMRLKLPIPPDVLRRAYVY
jgi:putative ABC transport system substrate-binding protein